MNVYNTVTEGACAVYAMLAVLILCAVAVVVLCRTGHAITLPRHRDHVFRPKNCCLLYYVYVRCGFT